VVVAGVGYDGTTAAAAVAIAAATATGDLAATERPPFVPTRGDDPAALIALPYHCTITSTITPSPSSHEKINSPLFCVIFFIAALIALTLVKTPWYVIAAFTSLYLP
jgi:hypothetical protein